MVFQGIKKSVHVTKEKEIDKKMEVRGENFT
jgi:hypothetical protein